MAALSSAAAGLAGAFQRGSDCNSAADGGDGADGLLLGIVQAARELLPALEVDNSWERPNAMFGNEPVFGPLFQEDRMVSALPQHLNLPPAEGPLR